MCLRSMVKPLPLQEQNLSPLTGSQVSGTGGSWGDTGARHPEFLPCVKKTTNGDATMADIPVAMQDKIMH